MGQFFRSPIVSAIFGGATVAVVFLVLGITGRRQIETVVEQAPMSTEPSSDHDLTPHSIYVRDAPGVVFVRATAVQNVYDPFELYPEQQRSTSTGSGFLIDESGRILTNYHVIEGAQSVTVQFEDNITRTAKIVGEDANDDLALLQVDVAGVTAKPLALGDSATVQVGDPTLAIGNPFGLDRTLTSGIVSALQREIQAPNGFAINNVIQTDAPINPGNSGGPLLDAAGRVIGINSQIATAGGGSNGSVGIAFAVPIDTARQFLPKLEQGGETKVAYLGVGGATASAPRRGVLVTTSGGPAASAGIRHGEVIESIDGRTVGNASDLTAIIKSRQPGQTVTLRVRSGRRTRSVRVHLATRPSVAP
jgi:S1-C subfamily serine protease